MPKMSRDRKMLQHTRHILQKITFILIVSQLLTSIRAGVINKREIMASTVMSPTQTEFLDTNGAEIGTTQPIKEIIQGVEVKLNDAAEILHTTKSFVSDSKVKTHENEVEIVETKLKQGNITEIDDKMEQSEMRLAQKKQSGFTDLVKENDMTADYFDYSEESKEIDDLEDLKTLAPASSTTVSTDLFENTKVSSKLSNRTSKKKPHTTIPTSPKPAESENPTRSAHFEIETTTTITVKQSPELGLATTISPNIAENLAIAMQKLQELNQSEYTTQIQPKEVEVSNDIIAPSVRSGSEKRGKFINDNSTNQFNLLNASEVRTLLAMKTVPAKPSVAVAPPDNKTLHDQLINDQNKNVSAIMSGNSEKTLLDWTQIMMNENLNSTEVVQTDRLHQEKPFQRLSQAYTTMMPPVDTNTIITMVVNDNSITTTESNELDATEATTNLAIVTTTERLATTTTDLISNLSSIVAATHSPSISEMPLTSIASANSFSPPTTEPVSKQSSQPAPVSLATNVSTDSPMLSTEFLSTTTRPTTFPPALNTSIATTTILSPSFPHDNENKANLSDENSIESTTENTATTTQRLSSDLSSPAQETTEMFMENTTNTAQITTQATAIKSVLDTPKNLSTTINETTSIATTTPTSIKQMQSSTRQPPLPENNLITNLHPPQPAHSNNDDDDNHEVTVKINHHNNESYDEQSTNAQVVGEEATLELSNASGTTVSRSEASAESTTALADSSVNELLAETTTITSVTKTTTEATTTTTTTTTLELTTLTPSVSVRENENSHSTASDNQRVTTDVVDLDATFTTTTTATTTTESFPTSSSAVDTILYVNKDVKSTTTSFAQEDFSSATATTTEATLAAVLHKTTVEPLSNFVETTTPATTTTTTTATTTTIASVTATPNEDSTVFQNHSTQADLTQIHSQLPNNSIDMNLIDQPENSEKLKENNANNLKTPVKPDTVNAEVLSSTTTTPQPQSTSVSRSTTTERLLISLLDDSSTASTITSSSSTSNEVYEVIATTEAATTNPPTTATPKTTTAINEPTVAPDVQTPVPDIRMIAATTSIVSTTMLPIELETVKVDSIGGPHLQPDTVDPPEMDVNVIIAISISVIGIVALILLVAFLYVVRKRQKQMSYGHRCRPVSLDAYSMDNVSVYNSVRRKGALRASKRSYGNVAFDDPSLTHNILNATELSKFMEKRSSIFEEFKYVPQIIARPDEVPTGCEDKNRYANVIPIPETRVSLQRQNDDEKSEYINGNYVRGPRDSPNYYIACQAPLESTVADFWRMIWEQKSRVIIQATDLVENGIEKCAEYLPPSVTLDNHTTYADFQITLKHREIKDKYAISTLILKNTLVNASRELTHYWYKWPETGVPSEEAPIIAMLLEARCSLKTYAIEEANELKATAISKSTTVTTLKTDSRDASGATSPDNQSANGSSAADNTNQSNSAIDIIPTNEKINKSAANSQGPLTVHCSPGTGRTGTIIGCDIAIRSLETPKRNVDIPQIVYYVRRGRASAVQTKEQYEFIYKIANMYASKITNVSNET